MVYIIAEAGVNHNGKLKLALKLCAQAKEAGADAVKFQTFKTEKNITKYAQMAKYQKQNLKELKSQYEMAKELELSFGAFRKIKKYCDKIGLVFLSTPDEKESLDFLISLGIEIIKIGSGEIDNLPYLKEAGTKGKDVILSTGMSTLPEVKRAYATLLEAGANSVALLHCTTSYPCPLEDVNLRAMLALKRAFKTRVGYSDHTLGTAVPIAAVALGAEIIEKHFTLDKRMNGPDHQASLEPPELKEMVKAVRSIEKALGDGLKKPAKSERENIGVIRRSIVAAKEIKKGQAFTDKNIAAKRPACGISPTRWHQVIGKIAPRDFHQDEAVSL